MSKPASLLVCAAVALSGASAAQAAEGYPWRQHEAPYDFKFGNEIDTHQQTRQARDGSLNGFFYVRFTGMTTKDRYPVATHVDCNAHTDCSVGWTLSGKPASGQFLYHAMHDHPVFLVGRSDIPQPGSYAHFHWLGQLMQPNTPMDTKGYLLQLQAVDRFCFVHHDAEMSMPATGKTCRENGGVAVEPGIDIATHLNIVTSTMTGM